MIDKQYKISDQKLSLFLIELSSKFPDIFPLSLVLSTIFSAIFIGKSNFYSLSKNNY